MFKHNFKIKEEIIQIRTGKTKAEYIGQLIDFIKKQANQQHILEGLGEVLDEKQKIWVKTHLLEELLFELEIRKDT